MATLKIEDWSSSNYSRTVSLGEDKIRQLEIEVIDKLIEKGLLPKGTFMVTAKLEISCHVQLPKEEMAKSPWVMHTYEMVMQSHKRKEEGKEGENVSVEEVKQPERKQIKDVVEWNDKGDE